MFYLKSINLDPHVDLTTQCPLVSFSVILVVFLFPVLVEKWLHATQVCCWFSHVHIEHVSLSIYTIQNKLRTILKMH